MSRSEIPSAGDWRIVVSGTELNAEFTDSVSVERSADRVIAAATVRYDGSWSSIDVVGDGIYRREFYTMSDPITIPLA